MSYAVELAEGLPRGFEALVLDAAGDDSGRIVSSRFRR